MALHLSALATLPGVPVFVDRQKDVLNMVAGKVAKGGAGACVTLLYEGFINPDASASNLPNVIQRYTATVYSRPVLQKVTDMPADDIVEAVRLGLHQWDPAEIVPGFVEIHVLGGDLRGDPRYLIYDLDIKVITRL